MTDPDLRTPTRSTPGARAQEIIDTALRLFATRGFRGTTVAAVAEEVGITDAGVLHHYPTKKALLLAALDCYYAQQLELFQALLAPGGLEAIRNLGDWGQVMEAQPHLLGLEVTLSTEAIEPSSQLHEFFVQRYTLLRQQLAQIVQEGIDEGTIRPDVDAEHEVACALALLDGLRLQWFLVPGRIPLAAHARRAMDDLVARIAVPTPGPTGSAPEATDP